MADPFAKVSAGQPLSISAAAWNAMLEAGQQGNRDRLGREGAPATGSPFVPTTRVYVKNDTGGTLPVFSVVAIAGTPLISATDEIGRAHV